MDRLKVNKAIQLIIVIKLVIIALIVSHIVKSIPLASDVVSLIGLYYTIKLVSNADSRLSLSYDFDELPNLFEISDTIIEIGKTFISLFDPAEYKLAEDDFSVVEEEVHDSLSLEELLEEPDITTVD